MFQLGHEKSYKKILWLGLARLKIFASLDLNLKESLKNEGWFEECHDTKLIVRLWKEFKPSLPGKIILILT